MIDEAIAGLVPGLRQSFLIDLRETIQEFGIPVPEAQKLNACIMPFIFQELNYDDLDWSSRNSSLGRLQDLVEIDVAICSGGRRRSEMTDAEYALYHNFCLQAIRYRSKQ